MVPRIAFAGWAREGKDVAATPLINAGYARVAFGDIIKRQVDPLVRQYLGYSAFTEDNAQKTQIRGLLEQWGEANYAGVMKEFFDGLPPRAVNTRLVRVAEASRWREEGGVIWRVRRPGAYPATIWEDKRLKELYEDGLIDDELPNDGDIPTLWRRVVERAGCATGA